MVPTISNTAGTAGATYEDSLVFATENTRYGKNAQAKTGSRVLSRKQAVEPGYSG
jgi:hypothetical protein